LDLDAADVSSGLAQQGARETMYEKIVVPGSIFEKFVRPLPLRRNLHEMKRQRAAVVSALCAACSIAQAVAQPWHRLSDETDSHHRSDFTRRR